MKLQTAYVSYVNLTPDLKNSFSSVSHQQIMTPLRKHFFQWSVFFDKYGSDYSMGFFITTMKGINQIEIKKPSVSKKMKIVDYSIFLPDEIKDLNHYIDLVFEGIGIVLGKFNVPLEEVEKMKSECKVEIGL